MNCELMLTYHTPALWQTGSRNLRFCWFLYTFNIHLYMHIFRCIFLSNYWWQESDIWSQAWYRYDMLWEAFLDPSDSYFLFADLVGLNETKNEHICSMCIKINKVGKQVVGIRWVQKRYPQYGIPIWCLWPNIRFLPSTVTEKIATKNILDDRRTDRGKTVYPPPPSGSGGINIFISNTQKERLIDFDNSPENILIGPIVHTD
jgi:hypothetical protein